MSQTQPQTKGETMTTTAQRQTPGEVVQQQHRTILQAIALLQDDLDAMTSTISPDTDNWGDVSEFAHVADMARDIVQRYDERTQR